MKLKRAEHVSALPLICSLSIVSVHQPKTTKPHLTKLFPKLKSWRVCDTGTSRAQQKRKTDADQTHIRSKLRSVRVFRYKSQNTCEIEIFGLLDS